MENRKGTIDFRVQKMDLIFEQSKGASDQAYRHDYYTLLIVEKGSGVY